MENRGENLPNLQMNFFKHFICFHTFLRVCVCVLLLLFFALFYLFSFGCCLNEGVCFQYPYANIFPLKQLKTVQY